MDLKSRLLAFKGRLRREPVAACAELDGFDAAGLYVRELNAAEYDAFRQSRYRLKRVGERHEAEPDLANITARLLVLTLCNEQGERVFGEEDAEALGQLPTAVLSRWFEQAERLSGLSKEEEEGARKNLNGQTPPVASPSALL